MKLTVCLVVVVLCSSCVSDADTPSGRARTELFERFSIPSLTFNARKTWPPQNAKNLVPFLVEGKKLDPVVLKEWKSQEDWLLAIRRLTFQHHEEKELKKYWLQNWRGKGERTVYVTWEQDGICFFGRRDFHNGECLFLILPEKAEGFDFTGSVESARNLVNSLVGKRAKLSLEPLEEVRTISVAEEDGRTVRKKFSTAIVFKKKHGGVLFLHYWGDIKETPSLSPSVWLSPKELLVVIQDPCVPAMSIDIEGRAPLYSPPESVTNPKDNY